MTPGDDTLKDYRSYTQTPANPDEPLAPGQDMYITLRPDVAYGPKATIHYSVVTVNPYGLLVHVWEVDYYSFSRRHDRGMAFLPWASIALIEPVTFARLEESAAE